MAHNWKTTRFTSVKEVNELFKSITGKNWLYRGQSRRYNVLIPTIDRDEFNCLSRSEKLEMERKSIDCFRSNTKYFGDAGEIPSLTDDVIALMVLRHYGVPTRLMDWSSSPYKALFFAVAKNDEEDGELWTFNRILYEEEGAKQWIKWPQTTTDGSGDRNKFDLKMPNAFISDEPPDWFVCFFYVGFPRQIAQDGAYSFTARFNKDHAESIQELLKDNEHYNLYIIPKNIKAELRKVLQKNHGIWRGPLFPDSAGAADTVKEIIFRRK